ncbi:hypothetical protein PR202_ga14023 [Eleusine coracana subsp. coracana]|uniref:Uncharacterized protein n=1 Tax=Eleusine coracana subsp. coracana TaxID=191504 RepID=A0AAV5CG85_ELECO|nr:hypothetical protein PR202_ga14023 [Eleusine coracana subsp. coracana]
MDTALFSAASLFHGDDSDDDRDEMQVDAEGQKHALEYVERDHDFPGMKLCVREFSCHELNANLLWPGTFSFATWLVKNQSILEGQRILELGRPDWDIVIASDILLYVKQYENLVKTLSFLLKEYKQNVQKTGCVTITDKSGTQIPAKTPMFLMSWRRRIGKDQSLFFTGCETAGMEVQHVGDLVYLISIRK